jgi:ankyrin repeat protein
MKSSYILTGIAALSAIMCLNGMQKLTSEELGEIERVQEQKFSIQKEKARPSVYKIIDDLYAENKWNGIFTVLDEMRNVINVNEYRTLDNKTLLGAAVARENFMVAKTLLEKYKANPNILSAFPAYGYSHVYPLMMACANQDLPMIKLLLFYNANPNLKNKNGATSFDYTRGNPEIKNVLEPYKIEE